MTSTRFQKGHTPHNKGKKNWWKPAGHIFKKGCIPKTAKPVGYETVDSYGFHKIKVEGCRRMKFKHYVIWERENNATVPKGCILRFVDGDKNNLKPENIVCLTRAENVVLNHRGFTDAPIEIRLSLIAIVKLELSITTSPSPLIAPQPL